jgi:hypothetical protein
MIVAQAGSAECVEQLLKKGADVSAQFVLRSRRHTALSLVQSKMRRRASKNAEHTAQRNRIIQMLQAAGAKEYAAST